MTAKGTAKFALRHGYWLLSLDYLLLLAGAWRGLLPLVLLGAATAGGIADCGLRIGVSRTITGVPHTLVNPQSAIRNPQ